MKHYISLGAGVQSSTMALMCAAGEITPMPDGAIFADTQAEPKKVYEWLDWLEKQLPFKVYRVTAGNLWHENMRQRVSKKNGKTYYKYFVPTFTLNPDGSTGMLPRKCTTDFKLVPIYRTLRKLAEVKRGEKEVRVVSLIGISLDEAHRMKPAKHPWVENRYPLVDARITRTACLAWMRSHGYPEPPKSACVFCPYHDGKMWLRLKNEEPEEFARAVQFEKDLQSISEKQGIRGREFLHSSHVPLEQVDFRSLDEKNGQTFLEGFQFGNECEGMCGV